MNINLESNSGSYEIESYDDNEVVIRTIDKQQLVLQRDFILSPSKLFQEKAISFSQYSDIEYLISLKPEVLVVSTHDPHSFPKDVRKLFEAEAIGVEVMKIGSGCRTYNLLASELRNIYLVIQF